MLRSVVLILTAVTGFTGLAYEVAWQKYLGILLGAHSEATAAVLALFLGGLSVGYGLFGMVTRRLVERADRRGRPPPLLLVYGAVEAAIGVYCLVFPWLFPGVQALSVWIPAGGEALAFAVDVGLAALLILPPAILMGGTIPMLTQALAHSIEDATRFHALIYGFNTVGATAGALAAGFVLIHWLGLEGVMRAMGAINVIVGITLALLGARRRRIVVLDSEPVRDADASSIWVYGGAALLVGFAMMMFQNIVIRIGGLSFGSSEYTFSMVVAVFVLCIALGSFAVSAFPRIPRWVLPASLWLLCAVSAGLYFALQTGPYWAHTLRTLFRDNDQAFPLYYGVAFFALLAAIGPVVVLSGAQLPLLFHALRRDVGELGSQAGRLYSANTVGSLLGSLLGGYVLLFWLDMHQIYRVALCSLVLGATLITLRQYPRLGYPAAAALFLVGYLAVNLMPAWQPSFLSSGLFRSRHPSPWTYLGPAALPHHGYDYIFYQDDPTATVAVQEYRRGGSLYSRSIYVNGKVDGNSRGDYQTTALLAVLPALFAERAEQSFVIGYGTGVTAGEMAVLEESKRVRVSEISRGVIEASRFFEFVNHGAASHPQVEILRSDAYRALLKGDESYDVIVSEPSNPWVTGVEMLYSKEFLSEAKHRLNPGGVYCQWYHLYETNSEAVELVLATFESVFEHVAVWSVNSFDLLLLGFEDDRHLRDLVRLEARMTQPDFQAALRRLGIFGLGQLLVHEAIPAGVLQHAELTDSVHTLLEPRLSHVAGRGFFTGAFGSVPFLGYGEPARVGERSSLLRRHLARFSEGVPERVRERMTSRACRRGLPACASLLARWSRGAPRSPILARVLSIPAVDNRWRERLPRLEGFVPGERGEGASTPLSLEESLMLTEDYMANYSFGLPFDPRALLDVWERCEGEGPRAQQRCQTGLRQVRRLVSGRPPEKLEDWFEGSHTDSEPSDAGASRAVAEPQP